MFAHTERIGEYSLHLKRHKALDTHLSATNQDLAAHLKCILKPVVFPPAHQPLGHLLHSKENLRLMIL